MIATAYWSLNAMESEARSISRGLREHEPELLHRLIVQYQHRLLRYLVHLAGRRDLAEDLFQETWVRVLERGHQYDGRCQFSTWLYAVARNLTIDHFRRKDPVSLDSLMRDEEETLFDPTDTRPSPWEVVAQQQRTEHISAALMRIPAQCREAIVLRFQDGMALEEIAALTEVPLGTVKSRLYRGLNMLTTELGGMQA
jgi:RNA polymerase sigma-70 factor, ECF subfamily